MENVAWKMAAMLSRPQNAKYRAVVNKYAQMKVLDLASFNPSLPTFWQASSPRIGLMDPTAKRAVRCKHICGIEKISYPHIYMICLLPMQCNLFTKSMLFTAYVVMEIDMRCRYFYVWNICHSIMDKIIHCQNKEYPREVITHYVLLTPYGVRDFQGRVQHLERDNGNITLQTFEYPSNNNIWRPYRN